MFIIPCFNEEAALTQLLTEIKKVQLTLSVNSEVVVVNDCSTDATAEVAESFGIKVLDLKVNCGIGGAMQTGFMYAMKNEFDFAMQLDGDGQHPPTEVYKLLAANEKTNADIIIGSRFIEKKGYQSSALRKMGIAYLSWLNQLFTGNKVTDTTSGFRLYNRKAIVFVAATYPDEYPEPQSLVDFYKARLSVVEVPVRMAERQGGQSSIRHFNQLYYLLKVTIAMFFSFIRNKK